MYGGTDRIWIEVYVGNDGSSVLDVLFPRENHIKYYRVE